MSDGGSARGLPTISAREALGRVMTNDVVLVDVREQYEWDAGHSPRARSLPMSELNVRLSELPHDQTLAVVCHAGSRSARVASALIEAGYDATNVEGGMLAWVEAGGEIVSEGPGEPTVD